MPGERDILECRQIGPYPRQTFRGPRPVWHIAPCLHHIRRTATNDLSLCDIAQDEQTHDIILPVRVDEIARTQYDSLYAGRTVGRLHLDTDTALSTDRALRSGFGPNPALVSKIVNVARQDHRRTTCLCCRDDLRRDCGDQFAPVVIVWRVQAVNDDISAACRPRHIRATPVVAHGPARTGKDLRAMAPDFSRPSKNKNCSHHSSLRVYNIQKQNSGT